MSRALYNIALPPLIKFDWDNDWDNNLRELGLSVTKFEGGAVPMSQIEVTDARRTICYNLQELSNGLNVTDDDFRNKSLLVMDKLSVICGGFNAKLQNLDNRLDNIETAITTGLMPDIEQKIDNAVQYADKEILKIEDAMASLLKSIDTLCKKIDALEGRVATINYKIIEQAAHLPNHRPHISRAAKREKLTASK